MTKVSMSNIPGITLLNNPPMVQPSLRPLLPVEHPNRTPPKLPAVLALFLLSVQIVIPWTVPHFVTQDGPSHVYSALVARDLLIHRDSKQRFLYHFRPGIVPNWTCTVLLAAIATLGGAENAERVMVDICVLVGFLSFRYATRAISSEPRSFSPLANFLFNTWFLWLGFFNFALGVALCPFVIGYFVRNRRVLAIRHTVIIAVSTGLIFFTHLIPAAITVLAVVSIAVWTSGKDEWTKPSLRVAGLAALAMLPTVLLISIYVIGFHVGGNASIPWHPEFEEALANFPMHVFATAAGQYGGQNLLVPGIVLYIAVGVLGLRRSEWRSEKGALVVAMLVAFLLYLFVPDVGLGGSMAKIRFVWIVFVLGGLVAASTVRTRFERPLAIYIALLLGSNLFATWQSLHLTSRAVEDYLSATGGIPRGAVFVRIHYPTPRTGERYGLALMGRDPLFHLDAYVASRSGSIDLSDYEGLNPIFPLALRPRIGEEQRAKLWSLEGPGEDGAASLDWLRENLSVPIDYVVLVGDDDRGQSSPPGLALLTANLNSEMSLVATAPSSFVKVYRIK